MAYDELTQVVTVTEANKLIKEALDVSFYQIIIKGEISGYRPSSSGHAYFDLKDSNASLPCCIFKSALYGMFKFQNGDLVTATGRVSLYEKTGKLSFIITKMVRQGDGELQALIEKRKLYYQNLGWFDPATKKALPENITKIGVVTSATGAVIHDILDVTRRRAPGLDIILFPCAVQGKGAEVTIASRIRQANNFDACDVLIVGRGGGSAEDLAPFSEDDVIIAIHESHIPVISAVGHEVDWALSDYVADVRAGTPSIAAEMVTKTIYDRRSSFHSVKNSLDMLMRQKLLEAEKKIPSSLMLESLMNRKLAEAKGKITNTSELLAILERKTSNASFRLAMAEEARESAFVQKVQETRRLLENLKKDCGSTLPERVKEAKEEVKSLKQISRLYMENRIGIQKESIKAVKKEIEALNPLSILERGYAVVTDKDGHIIRQESEVENGDILSIRLNKGQIKASAIKEK